MSSILYSNKDNCCPYSDEEKTSILEEGEYECVHINEENKNIFIQTKNSVLLSVQYWGTSIQYVHDEFITYKLYKIAIINDDNSIKYVNRKLITDREYYKLCLLSIKKFGLNIKFIPPKFQTQKLVDIAINSCCWAYQYCLDEFKTFKNSFLAVQKNGQIIKYIPRHIINKDICLTAINTKYCCLDLIPKEFISQNICMDAVKTNGENIKGVPYEFMSYELARIAINTPSPEHVKLNMASHNIQYIHTNYITKNLIIECVKKCFGSYGKIPKQCLTEEIINAVLDVQPYCILYMEQTPYNCLKAIKNCPFVIEHQIINKNITKEMAEYILSLDYNIKKKIYYKSLEYLESLI